MCGVIIPGDVSGGVLLSSAAYVASLCGSLCVCVSSYLCKCVCVRPRASECMGLCVCTGVCMCPSLCMCVDVCVHVYIACTYLYAYAYVSVCLCVWVCCYSSLPDPKQTSLINFIKPHAPLRRVSLCWP